MTVTHYRYVCAGGPEARHRHLPSFGPDEVQIPAYDHWRQIRHLALATRVTPGSEPFAATAVNNGVAWPEDMPNLWVSDPAQPLPQWVQLRWAEPQRFSQVMVAFDTQLDLKTSERPALWAAPECVRDWRLQAEVDGGWLTLHEEAGNHQRRRVVSFDAVTSSAVRLQVLATNGDPSARVFEMRVYDR